MAKTNRKKILTFDTNFIIENQSKFQEIINNLSEEYDVYVPQLAINERIAQQTRKVTERYEIIRRLCKENQNIIKNLSFKKNENDYIDLMTKNISETYASQFGEFIIPFESENINLYKNALDRAMKKMPPFLKDKNASDKGFKDCLLWLSLIDYFKTYNFDGKIYFITKDNGFINNSQSLIEEFKKETKIDIEIKSVVPSLYVEETNKQEVYVAKISNYNLDELRNELREALNNFCYSDVTDYYGGYDYTEESFQINDKINKEQAEMFLKGLKSVLNENLLATVLFPSDVFGENYKILDKHKIEIGCVENIAKIYENISKNNLELLAPLCNEVASQINNNYSRFYADDDDLPF